MIIKPSTALRNEYTEISRLCKETGEPIFLTKNGEGDLVVMDITAYNKKQILLELKQKLLEAEENRINGSPKYTHEEIKEKFKQKSIEARKNV